ncbi:hypothetical protein [Neisseria shayeganii]|uniref:Nodulation efficiency family protein n=2 Tax=Neisseria shayeganii TaxID=607712 RepID=G4CEU3_9NEIS|nr:hypothetical protein [Neisseria shayeganii]EGY53678.1 nodulation efficiency family protein [Neisseria shayeganii 871]QMT39536.1 hypothetical protein H3L94_06520 [Neisseria shayeganii]
MSKSDLDLKEQRELLALKADLVRLKIALAKRQQQMEDARQVSSALPLAPLISGAEKLYAQPLLWKLALWPSRWKHKLLLGGALMAWQWWRSQQPR